METKEAPWLNRELKDSEKERRKLEKELQDEEKDKLDSQVIATDGIAVIVNKNNTTNELSSDQVKTIYTGDATTWDEVVK